MSEDTRLVRVFDLDTDKDGPTYTCDPRMAVICAHAQSLGDWNTWDYETAWGHMVVESDSTVRCGSFTTSTFGTIRSDT